MKSTETITLSGVSSTGDASPDVNVPREIGSIRLIKEIGRGGMGVVWQGHDRLLGRDVAVKFLLQTVDDESDEHVARLLAGARAAANVDHANLTAIYHADIIESTPYLVMQLVDGVSVKDLLRRGGLQLTAACDIMVQTCNAVAALHNRDVVHRDIKPSNLLIDDGGKIYVTDFGLSFDRKYAGVDTAGLAGTPPYMAPEMFEGAITLRSDVYALGITCFELLAGELPFAGDLVSLRQQHAQRELPVDKLRAKEIPQPVIDVIVRAAHKTPHFRHRSAEQFGRAIRSALPEGLELVALNLATLLDGTPTDETPILADPEETKGSSSYFDRLADLAEHKRNVPKVAMLSSPPHAIETVPAVPNDIVGDNVSCICCDYLLRSVSRKGTCPECGEPIESSFDPARLQFSDPAFLQIIGKALRSMSIPIWGMFGVTYISVKSLDQPFMGPFVMGLGLIFTVRALVLGIKMTKRESHPALPESSLRIGRFARAAQILAIGFFIVAMVTPLRAIVAAPSPTSPSTQFDFWRLQGKFLRPCWLVLILTASVAFAMSIAFMGRIPDRRILRNLRLLMLVGIAGLVSYAFMPQEALILALVWMVACAISFREVGSRILGLSKNPRTRHEETS